MFQGDATAACFALGVGKKNCMLKRGRAEQKPEWLHGGLKKDLYGSERPLELLFLYSIKTCSTTVQDNEAAGETLDFYVITAIFTVHVHFNMWL